MSLDGGPADRVDDGIDLVTLAEGVERGKGHADLRPQGAEDELAPAGRAYGAEEVSVLPHVERSSGSRR
jgi:hypothetical protein